MDLTESSNASVTVTRGDPPIKYPSIGPPASIPGISTTVSWQAYDITATYGVDYRISPGQSGSSSVGVGADSPFTISILDDGRAHPASAFKFVWVYRDTGFGNSVTITNTVNYTIAASTGNTAPVARPDSYSVSKSSSLTTLRAGGVLANDTDADAGDTALLTAQLAQMAAHGSLTLRSDGSFTYTPTTDFVGTETFSYRADDGHSENNFSSVVTATITVTDTPGSQPSDLIVVGNQTSSSSVAAGGSVTFSYWVNNLGSGSSAASKTGIFLSTDFAITTSDTLLTVVNTPALSAANSAGSTDFETVQFTVPTSLARGTYYIGAIADYDGRVGETNEANNASIGFAINVTPRISDNGSVQKMSGPSKNYNISLTAGSEHITVGDRVGSGGSSSLSVNNVEFSDVSLNLNWLRKTAALPASQISDLTKLYIASFNRAPDALGLDYWGSRFYDGMKLQDIAASFFVQPEAAAAYPVGQSTQTFVTQVYSNVLGRAPDAAGLSYWAAGLQNNSISKNTFLLAIINGAQGADLQYLANKEAVGGHFALTQGLSETAWAAQVMANVNGTAGSVTAANQLTDSFAATANSAAGSELVMKIVGIVP